MWLRLRSYERIDAPVDATAQVAGTTTDAAAPFDAAAPQSPTDTGTIIETNADGSSAQVLRTSSGSGVSARERRYNELLRAAPPAAPQNAAPAAKPSLLDRVVAPIASALGMRPKQPQQPTPAQINQQQQRQQQQQQQQQRAAEGSGSGNNSTTDTTRDPNHDDPETDVVAPQLHGAEFTPTQVQDGEETLFVVVVNDNLSGVRSVSGVVASPSGSMQGFACVREGDTNRYTTKIAVPKDAPAGIWSVKYLTLTDNASNSAHLNASQGALPASASFRVTSAGSDATGPQLKAVWLDKPAMRSGEKNTLFVQAEDDKAGVQLVHGQLVSPSRLARIGFGCRLGGTGAWECAIAPPACLDCGVWKIEQIQLQDKANNSTTFRGDNQLVSAVALDIAGERCDALPPVVTSLTLSPTVVSNAEGTVINVQATAIDDGGCGVASLSGPVVPPGGIGGARLYIMFDPSPDGQNFTGKIAIPQFA
ncbi:MAG TPA: hypothetical protein VE010_17440, partial [Thermoanaerobaculia bacterium]|nr:hypothetical protein [Thermoanaerobaculia bacterium]